MYRRRQGKSQARERIPTEGRTRLEGPTPFPSRERLDGRFSCLRRSSAMQKGGCVGVTHTPDLAPSLTPESGRCRSERRVVSMAPAQAASYVQQIPGLGLAGHLNRDALADAKPLAAAIRRWPQQSTDYRIRSPRPGGCTRLARPHRTSSGQDPRCLALSRSWDAPGGDRPLLGPARPRCRGARGCQPGKPAVRGTSPAALSVAE